MNDMHGILFAYSSDHRLKPLTAHRTACSLPFGARYRVIDFMLSNMVNSGIPDVGVIMREDYQSLLDHLGAGRDWDLARKRGGLRILPPFAYAGGSREAGTYRGKIDALNAIQSYISFIRQEYIVLADGDLIVNLPLEEIFERHVKSGADMTCVCTSRKDNGYAADAAFVRLGAGEQVTEVLLSALGEDVYPCIGVYILSKDLLVNLMNRCNAENSVDFTKDVLQRYYKEMRIKAFVYDGFAARLHTVADYFEQSMNLLKPEVRDDLFSRSRPIKTKIRDDAPTYYSPESKVKCSVVADGCSIRGNLENCIVFRGVQIEEGAVLKNCIFMQDSHIGKNTNLSIYITDKEVTIEEGCSAKGHRTFPLTIPKGSVVELSDMKGLFDKRSNEKQ
ncbi:MAG: glucose-1-phosphate adenylyltransferase subunit GlgD [Oscillospiraceae bacterium]|jgi:glucose-1-phosphate adenylyltransferase|nr:glucose-1-phosphate adenylyltransferase subunit GlgD [Oscillospiraceae bacterium]